jgi:CRP-like cAMP-binding protein
VLRRSAAAWRPHWRPGFVIVLALLQDQPRSASIKTLTPCVVISLSRRRFKRLVQRFPAMQPAIERRMARSVENLTSLQQSSSAAP